MLTYEAKGGITLIGSTGNSYTIGEFSAITGVSADTLRLYEKQGIIRPIKNDSNNYRYYTDLDARHALMSRWYRSMTIPLQQVSTLMNGGTATQVRAGIRESKSNLEEQIRKQTMLLAKINEIYEELQHMESRLNRCQKKRIPGRYRIKQTHENCLLRERSIRNIVHEWMDLLPYTFFSFRLENGYERSDNTLTYNWGLCLTEEDAMKLQVPLPDEVEYLPPAECLSSVIYVSQQAPFSIQSIAFMLEEINNQDLQVTGDITGKILVNEHTGNNTSSYLEVNIPL